MLAEGPGQSQETEVSLTTLNVLCPFARNSKPDSHLRQKHGHSQSCSEDLCLVLLVEGKSAPSVGSSGWKVRQRQGLRRVSGCMVTDKWRKLSFPFSGTLFKLRSKNVFYILIIQLNFFKIQFLAHLHIWPSWK